MKLLIPFLLLLNFCATTQEIIECEKNLDKTYPSAVSNCKQSEKEYNSKVDPATERMRR
jgi:hypothetical protein